MSFACFVSLWYVTFATLWHTHKLYTWFRRIHDSFICHIVPTDGYLELFIRKLLSITMCFIILDLKRFTKYRIRIQAYNSAGFGPNQTFCCIEDLTKGIFIFTYKFQVAWNDHCTVLKLAMVSCDHAIRVQSFLCAYIHVH